MLYYVINEIYSMQEMSLSGNQNNCYLFQKFGKNTTSIKYLHTSFSVQDFTNSKQSFLLPDI